MSLLSSRYRFFTLALGALVLAACSESVVSPAARPSTRGSLHDATAAQSFLHANADKYANNGARPATGRSGSAAIEARALLGKDGNTVIEATTGHMDASDFVGNIKKVQLKSLNSNGDAIKTVNFNVLAAGGYWTTTTPELGRGAPIQIQTNVNGIDPKRTDVVTVRATTKLRPDLAVPSVSAPAKAYVNKMFNVSGNVSEMNGDVGATANCVLLADGTQIDQSVGIWVDAGSTVSCAFTTKFASVGTHTLMVSATNVVPGDWDLANNSASTTIEIVEPIVKMAWYSNAYASNSRYSSSYTSHYNDCYYYWGYCATSDYQSNYGNDYQNASFSFSSYAYDVPATSPLHIAFTAASGANSLASLNTDLGYPSSVGCYNGYDAGAQGWFDACNYGSYTQFNYNRYAGSVTYYSWGYSHSRQTYYYCDWYGCYPYTYTYDNSWSYGAHYQNGVLFSLDGGSGVTAALTMTDANGTQYVAGGTYPLQSNSGGYTYQPYCYTYGYYYNYTQCYTQTSSWNQLSGYASGFGNTNNP